MKRLTSILVLFLLLAHLAGFYVYFVVRLNQVRNAARAELRQVPLSQLSRFEFTEVQFQEALVEDDEMKVAGRMYDIAKIVRAEKTVVVFARHDKDEDNLLAFFDKLENSWGDANDAPQSLTQFLSLNYVIEPTLTINDCESRVSHFTSIPRHYHFVTLKVDSPPPRV